MNHFLAPVLRQQFNLFYSFGYTFLPDAILIPFDGIIGKVTIENVSDLLKEITPFEYDEEYVILHLKREAELKSGNIRFEIQQLSAVFPLSQQARISISQKIDQRIKLGEPLFEPSLAATEAKINKEEIFKGIEALWSIYLKDPADKELLLALIGEDNILHGLNIRNSGKKASELKNENYWSYLLTYERYDYFPKEPIGYFFDAGQLFAFSKGKPTFENSQLHNLLTSLFKNNSKTPFEIIIKQLEQDSKAIGYVSQTIQGELKLYVLAPLFLFLKDEIRNAESFMSIKDSLPFSYAKKKFPMEFKAALILLGAFFKFKTFYDAYYNDLKLEIYQDKVKEPSKTPKSNPVEVETVLDNEGVVVKSLKPNQAIQTKDRAEVDINTFKEEIDIEKYSDAPVAVERFSQVINHTPENSDKIKFEVAAEIPINIEVESDNPTFGTAIEKLTEVKSPEVIEKSESQNKENDPSKVQLALGFTEPQQAGDLNAPDQEAANKAKEEPDNNKQETLAIDQNQGNPKLNSKKTKAKAINNSNPVRKGKKINPITEVDSSKSKVEHTLEEAEGLFAGAEPEKKKASNKDT